MKNLKLFTAIFISLFLLGASEVIHVTVVDHNELYLFGQEYEVPSLEKYEVKFDFNFEEMANVIVLKEQPSVPNINIVMTRDSKRNSLIPSVDINVTEYEEKKFSSRRRSSRSSKPDIDIDLTNINGTIPNIDIDVTKEEPEVKKSSSSRRSSRSSKPNIDIDLTNVNGTIPNIDIDITNSTNKTIPSIDIDVTKEESEGKKFNSRRRKNSKPDIDIDLTNVNGTNGTIPSIDIDVTKEESEGKKFNSRRRRNSKPDIDIDLTKAEEIKAEEKIEDIVVNVADEIEENVIQDDTTGDDGIDADGVDYGLSDDKEDDDEIDYDD